MKGAKELAERWRTTGNVTDSDIDWMINRLATIDSAVPGEVGEIARVHQAVEAGRKAYGIQSRDAHDAHTQRGMLLAIVQRQVGEILALRGEAAEQRELAVVLARGLAAYRVGGYTAGQVWENEEGMKVPR